MTIPVLNKEGLEKAREAFYAATTVLPTGTIRDLDVAGVVERLNKPWDGSAKCREARDAERTEAAALITALSTDNARLREKAIVGEYMWTPGEIMEVVARAEAAEARMNEMEAALRPFAEIADFVDAETEGFTDTDEFKLHFQDYLMASWPLSLFRTARTVAKEAGPEAHCCPVCAEPLKAGDTCATDIELGTCHAECLEGSPIVDLDTGEPTEGSISTYPYEEAGNGQ